MILFFSRINTVSPTFILTLKWCPKHNQPITNGVTTRRVTKLTFFPPEGIRTTIAVGEECVININAAEAGIGNITCSISSSADTDVDISVIDNGDGTVSIVYTPQYPGAYSINIQFGGQPVPNGQFNQEVGSRIHF